MYRSGDGGSSWQPAGQGLPTSSDGTGVEQLTIDPQRPTTIYATGHFNGVWRSDDRGGSWRVTNLKNDSVTAFALDPRAPATLYALTGDGPQRSADGGASWQPVGAGLPARTDVAFRFLRIDPQQPRHALSRRELWAASFAAKMLASIGARSTPACPTSRCSTRWPSIPNIPAHSMSPSSAPAFIAPPMAASTGARPTIKSTWRLRRGLTTRSTPVFDSALARSTDHGVTWHSVADVACGVTTVMPAPSGGVAASCLDGHIYALRVAQSPVAQPAAPAPPADSGRTNSGTGRPRTDGHDSASICRCQGGRARRRACAGAGPGRITARERSRVAARPSKLRATSFRPTACTPYLNTPDGAVEFITIGPQSYTKVKGTWIAGSPGGSNALLSPGPLGEALNQTATNVALVGTDTVNGTAAQVYAYTTRLDNQAISVKLWVDTATGLPVQIQSDSQRNGETVHGIETITYDPSITIDAPIS